MAQQTSITSFFKKTTPANESANQNSDKPAKEGSSTTKEVSKKIKKFSKADLTSAEQKLLKLELETMGSDWFDILLPEFKKPYFAKLKQELEKKVKQDKVYPPLEQIYSWSKYTPFDKVKVVIIGQDPYHQPRQAHGLAFSVNKGVYIPPSLQNIYKGIKIDYPEFNIPKHGYLKKWADQGVLLLNTVLTVKESNPNSHKSLQWEKLTDEIIKQIGVNRSNVVFLLWGNNAKQKAAFIDRSKNLILESVHPSPLSVRHGFFSAKHFIKTNEYLEANGLETIDWGKVNEE